MTENCVFCRIVRGELPARMVYEDEQIVAFRDTNPMAPVHILLVPRIHITNASQLDETMLNMAGRLLLTARNVATSEGVADKGYRLVINNGADGGQTVMHLHVHLLAGRKLGWPPG